MRKILGKIFATIGFLVVMSLLSGVLIGLWFAEKPTHLPDRMTLTFDFSRPVLENYSDDPVGRALGDDSIAFSTLVRTLDRAAKDERVMGFIADVSDVGLEPAQIEEVRAVLKRFNAAGKFSIAYADSLGEMGPANRHYWLASAFQQVWMQPLGTVGITGPAASMPFARRAFDRLGIIPDMHQRQEYKGAADMFTQSTISAPLREDYQKLLNGMQGQMVTDIAAARQLSEREVRRLMDKAPLLANEALTGKLIDHLGYHDEMRAEADQLAPGSEDVDVADYLPGAKESAAPSAGTVALIYVTGPIVRRDFDSGPFGERTTTSAESLVAAIDEAAEGSDYAAIILRIDSPGGSVTASETIHRAIDRARKNGKYIVVSMGGTAASGGYWIATAANSIVANANTVTGSIGVVGGKFAIGPISEKLGVSWVELGTGANSTMWSGARPFSGGGLARIDASLDEIYQSFVDRVREGRKLPAARVDRVARGRIWLGAAAKEVGLVDRIGGLKEAFNVVREHLGVDEDAPLSFAVLPRPVPATERLIEMLRYYVTGPTLDPMGEIAPFLRRSASALGLPYLEDGPMAIAPELIIH